MNIVIFGLSISSSWGNGHATIWRGLIRELIKRGHTVIFFEKDVLYYSQNRDFWGMDGLSLILYESWNDIIKKAEHLLTTADIGIITSYCPDALSASELLAAREVPLQIFYDLDAAVTLKQIESGQTPPYIGKRLLRDYDLVLSYTGGSVLTRYKNELNVREIFPLYGCVDPLFHHPVKPAQNYQALMSYLGTYACDRQAALEKFFIDVAKRNPQQRFILGGAQYPLDFPKVENIHFITHVPPCEHSEFYCSSKFTLNVTRSAMAEMGYSPSGRLFEAAACCVPVISDAWDGVEQFFIPEKEIIIANDTEDVINALNMHEDTRLNIAEAFYKRVINEHTAMHRVKEFEKIVSMFL